MGKEASLKETKTLNLYLRLSTDDMTGSMTTCNEHSGMYFLRMIYPIF